MWRYVSDTQTIGGVPARDLTDAEFSKLEGWLAAIVRNSGIYRYETPAPVEAVSVVGSDEPVALAAPEPPARKPLARKTK